MATSDYWRAGYQIAGADPVTVVPSCSAIDEAKSTAAAAGEKAQSDLVKLGLGNEITWWIEKHTVTVSESVGPRTTFTRDGGA